MNKFLRHIMAMLCAVLAVMLTACGVDDGAPQEPEEGLYMVCRIGLVGETRANSVPDNEAMHSLRMIILSSQGVVESNDFFDFTNIRETYNHITEIKREARKRVYLIANEKSVYDISSDNAAYSLSGSLHDMLEGVSEGDDDFEAKINSVHYIPNFDEDIPLTAMYDVDIPEGVRLVEKDFWLVRVATKFTFVFENHRKYDDVRIDRFEISKVSDSHYLMPRFTDGVVPIFPGFTTWIDWLKDVSDKSQIDPENPSADESGWLTGYEVPATAKHQLLTYSRPFTLAHMNASGRPGIREITNLYAPESKQLRPSGSTIDKEQEYTLHIECDNGARVFDMPLLNLRSLFRNTHVLVSVKISNGESIIISTIDVIPFSEVVLEPEFGL